MRRTWLFVGTLLITLARPETSPAGWVLPTDPEVPAGFSCWPGWSAKPRPSNSAREEEQEIQLVQFQVLEPPTSAPAEPAQEMGALAPRAEEIVPTQKLTLAEIALMGNHSHVVVHGVLHGEPSSPRRRSYQEVWLDCQDHMSRGAGHVGSGVSSLFHKLTRRGSQGCPHPE